MQVYMVLSDGIAIVGFALLLRWLGADWPPWWSSLTLMFQQEVAERICAAPDTDAYGRLSVLAQWRCRCDFLLRLPPRYFETLRQVVEGLYTQLDQFRDAGLEHAVRVPGRRPHALDVRASGRVGRHELAVPNEVEILDDLGEHVARAQHAQLAGGHLDQVPAGKPGNLVWHLGGKNK